MKNTLIAVLVIIILVIGYLFIKEKTKPVDYGNAWPETVPATPTNNQGDSNNNVSTPKLTNASVRAEWQSHSSEYLLGVAAKEGLGFESDFGLSLSEMTDLTGDGIDEGVFTGNGGNNGASFIMVKGSDGKSFVAKQKEKDGTIGPVYLVSIGRVMVSESFELLPSEQGFYTVSKVNEEESGKFSCKQEGVKGYKWNASTKLFEWNQTMVNKYNIEVCNWR